MGQTIGQV